MVEIIDPGEGREMLRAIAIFNGVDPDGKLCPDIERFCNMDCPIYDQVKLFAAEIEERRTDMPENDAEL